ncbi:MAG: RidA family protein [Candidatus Methylacidiphilales bacterium]
MEHRSEIIAEKAPAAIGPYSMAVSTGSLLFTSGQIPISPATGELVDGGIKEQAHQVLENLKAVLESGGADFSTVLKTTVFMTDLTDFAEMNAVYSSFFGTTKPARSTIQVAALPKGARVEIEAVAMVTRGF